MLLVGDPITGRRAYEIGLVGHVMPDGRALAKARELADRAGRQRSPRRAQHQGVGASRPSSCKEADAFQRELELGMEVMASKDAKEGPRAFLEKRAPQLHRASKWHRIRAVPAVRSDHALST